MSEDVEVHRTPSGREFVRTPDDRFADLPDFPYEPHYAEVDGLRVHYVDEGPAAGETVLLLHGQPDWAYLYRKMIPVLREAGHRVLAPDMVGMGRSDKPTHIDTHTVCQHVSWTWELLQELELHDVTLFCQDWGASIGLRLVAEHPERFARVMVSNGCLMRMPGPPMSIEPGIDRSAHPIDPDATVRTFEDFVGSVAHTIGPDMSAFFNAWMRFALVSPDFKPSQNFAVEPGVTLTEGEKAAYDAPFPSDIYRTGPRSLPSMASLANEEAELRAWESIQQFEKPFLTVFGELDPLIGGPQHQSRLIDNIPGAKGQPHDRILAGHFVQESAGEEVAQRLNAFIAANPR